MVNKIGSIQYVAYTIYYMALYCRGRVSQPYLHYGTHTSRASGLVFPHAGALQGDPGQTPARHGIDKKQG